MFVKQNKGKHFVKLPTSKIPSDNELFYESDKIDGAYTQVHVDQEKGNVKFYTSGGLQFHLEKAARGFILAAKAYSYNLVIFECEYNYGNEGKHGDRTSTGKITTYRTEFGKGIKTVGCSQDSFKLFDTIEFDRIFEERKLDMLNITETVNVKILVQKPISYGEAIGIAKQKVSEGWEGSMLKSPNHTYKTGKRTNDIIKIKFPHVGIATVLREIEGDRRLKGIIGALEVRFIDTDKNIDTIFNVGTGFSDIQRAKWGEYIGKKIQFEYESIQIHTPVQPSFKGLVDA